MSACVMTSLASAHDTGELLDWSKAPRDTLPWGLLAKVGVHYEDGRIVPQFLAPVLKLDGKRITLYGFMTTVGDDPKTRTRQFLLTETPLSCGSCNVVAPDGVVEVNARATVAPAKQAIAVQGVLHVLRSDPKSVLYRMTDAQIVTRR